MTHNNKGDKTVVHDDGSLDSHFLISAEEMKEKLDEVSPSLCLAKWQQVSLHLPTGLTNSCYHPPLHKIPLEGLKSDPSRLHNTPTKIEERKQMLAGERPEGCSYCWKMEDNGSLSDRHYRSGEPWASPYFDEIVNGNLSATPTYVEVNFNHVCNLACSYCSPQFSSTWMGEVARYGGIPTVPSHNDYSYFLGDRHPIPNSSYNPYVKAFWKWWPDLYPTLKHFRMTGGEPLMDRNTYKVFDYVLANPKSDLHLNVTSNFSVEPKLFDKYLDYVKRLCDGDNLEHFMQYVSIDGWGKQAEYMRYGLDFNRFMDNVNRYLEEIPYKNSLTFIITINILSIPSLRRLLEEILYLRNTYSKTYQRVWTDTPVLRSPTWQSIQIAPWSLQRQFSDIPDWMEQHLETIDTRFHGFKDYEVKRMERDVEWMREGLPRVEVKERMANFYRFFNEHDRRRDTDFLETFPELNVFWRQCKYEASK